MKHVLDVLDSTCDRGTHTHVSPSEQHSNRNKNKKTSNDRGGTHLNPLQRRSLPPQARTRPTQRAAPPCFATLDVCGIWSPTTAPRRTQRPPSGCGCAQCPNAQRPSLIPHRHRRHRHRRFSGYVHLCPLQTGARHVAATTAAAQWPQSGRWCWWRGDPAPAAAACPTGPPTATAAQTRPSSRRHSTRCPPTLTAARRCRCCCPRCPPSPPTWPQTLYASLPPPGRPETRGDATAAAPPPWC